MWYPSFSREHSFLPILSQRIIQHGDGREVSFISYGDTFDDYDLNLDNFDVWYSLA